MNTEQIITIRTTWKAVEPFADQLSALFFMRLRELDPTLDNRLGGDEALRHDRLIRLIGTTVWGLDRMPVLQRMADVFGKRHADSAVRPSDYSTFGAAWLWSMRASLGDEFTAKAEAAWTAVYGLIARALRHSVNQATATRSAA